jgi:hypothetical protein
MVAAAGGRARAGAAASGAAGGGAHDGGMAQPGGGQQHGSPGAGSVQHGRHVATACWTSAASRTGSNLIGILIGPGCGRPGLLLSSVEAMEAAVAAQMTQPGQVPMAQVQAVPVGAPAPMAIARPPVDPLAAVEDAVKREYHNQLYEESVQQLETELERVRQLHEARTFKSLRACVIIARTAADEYVECNWSAYKNGSRPTPAALATLQGILKEALDAHLEMGGWDPADDLSCCCCPVACATGPCRVVFDPATTRPQITVASAQAALTAALASLRPACASARRTAMACAGLLSPRADVAVTVSHLGRQSESGSGSGQSS